MINRTSPSLALTNWPASPFIAGALAVIIFVIDTFTPLDIAIAVLYVIVVLMAANVLRRRGVILVSLARLHQLTGLGDAKLLKSLECSIKGRHYRG